MASPIYAYDRYGHTKLGEFCQDVQREWLLNEPGSAEFSISVAAEIKRLGARRDLRDLVQFGNLIYIPGGTVGDWAGVITKRSWQNGILKIDALGLEKLFDFSTPQAPVKVKTNGGAIFSKILQIANSQIDSKMAAGQIFTGGATHSETIEVSSLLDTLEQFSSKFVNDFEVTATLNGGAMALTANWYEKMGDTVPFLLAESSNLVAPSDDLLVEDGEQIFNRIIGIPDTAHKDSKTYPLASDDVSASAYGKRWTSESLSRLAVRPCSRTLFQLLSPS